MSQRSHRRCRLKNFSQQYHSEFFKVNTLKIHGDGSIVGDTANLIEHQPSPEYLAKLGPERYERLMRLRTMVRMGIRVVLSQDYPSLPINPFWHMHAAAYMVRADTYSGSLETGKRADFIVLDRNLLEIPEDEIHDTRVLKTVVNGRIVYEAGGE